MVTEENQTIQRSIDALLKRIEQGDYEPKAEFPAYVSIRRSPRSIDTEKASTAEVIAYANERQAYDAALVVYRADFALYQERAKVYNAEAKVLIEDFRQACINTIFGDDLPRLGAALYDFCLQQDTERNGLKGIVETLVDEYLPLYKAAIQDKWIKQR